VNTGLKLLLNCAVILIVTSQPLVVAAELQAQEETVTFTIREFQVEGNTLLPQEDIQAVLVACTGPEKSAADVEAARDQLEKLYHQRGYITVLVNIPQQTVDEGIVRLEVIETTIRTVRVTGNRFFTREKLLRELPSLNPGQVLYLPDVQEELNRLNRNQDLTVVPALVPGRELGVLDVELQVKDRLPLHGSLELNNRATHETTDLRLNGMLRYDNLWQRDHSITLQFQVSPEDFDEVEVYSGSYSLPSPWNKDQQFIIYGIYSDSETTTGTGAGNLTGQSVIIGTRYFLSLPSLGRYGHNVSLGLDYKNIEEGGDEEVLAKTRIEYAPFSVSYGSSLSDAWGFTRFSSSLHMNIRGLGSDREDFEEKRFKATDNYVYFTAGLERRQKLPGGMELLLAVDGQVSNQPLVSTEQYSAGGMDSVRGYKESEELGDDAIHGIVELSAPNLAEIHSVLASRLNLTPYLFYDVAQLWVQDALPGQNDDITLQGAGAGVRGFVTRYLEFQLDWAIALKETSRTDDGNQRVHFRMKAVF
jgi:hemolysin activation/secretion protein